NNSTTLKPVIKPLLAELLPRDRILAVNDRSVDNSLSVLKELGVEVVPSTGNREQQEPETPGGIWLIQSGSFLLMPMQ
ncbi:MAG: hypothetical protein GY852_07590, partial [bacterium]|nr:hypothetical protein [bacterium]